MITSAQVTYEEDDIDRYFLLKEEIDLLRCDIKDKHEHYLKKRKSTARLRSSAMKKKSIEHFEEEERVIKTKLRHKFLEMRGLKKKLDIQSWTETLLEINNIVNFNACPSYNEKYPSSVVNKISKGWINGKEGLDKKVAFYAQRDEYILNCLDKTIDKKEVDVDETFSFLCEKINGSPDKYQTKLKKYRLKKENEQIVLSINLCFSYEGDVNNRNDSFRRLKDTKSCLEDFFARHGVKPDFNFYQMPGETEEYLNKLKESSNCDHHITLHDHHSRPNSSNWPTHTSLGLNLTARDRCLIFVHEFNHNLGLPDVYADSRCPDRERVMPRDDIMHADIYMPTFFGFYPYAIKHILKPLCGD